MSAQQTIAADRRENAPPAERQRTVAALGGSMRKTIIIVLMTSVLSGCHASTPNDLAQAVLMEEIGQLDGVRMGFVPCVSVDSIDIDARILESLRKVYPNVVPGSEKGEAILLAAQPERQAS